jgi:hypothetical protein
MYYWANKEKTGIIKESQFGDVVYLEPGQPEYDNALASNPQPPKIITSFKPPTEEEVRSMRNDKLSQSDWTQVEDAPVDQAAWATYRQALRDVPQQTGFPSNITWPEKPQ